MDPNIRGILGAINNFTKPISNGVFDFVNKGINSELKNLNNDTGFLGLIPKDIRGFLSPIASMIADPLSNITSGI